MYTHHLVHAAIGYLEYIGSIEGRNSVQTQLGKNNKKVVFRKCSSVIIFWQYNVVFCYLFSV